MNKNSLLCLLVLIFFTTTAPVKAQDITALTAKINEVQTRYLNGLKYQNANEYDKAIAEYTTALMGQKDLLPAVAMIPGFQRTILEQILTTASSIAYCHECKGDTTSAMQWYKEILGIAKTQSFKSRETITQASIANLYVKIYDYKNAILYNHKMQENVKESASAGSYTDDYYRSVQGRCDVRNNWINIFQLGLTLGKYDEIL